MPLSIKLDHDLKIVKYTHRGVIELDDIGMAWQQFLAMREFTEMKYNLFSDYRGSKFNFPSEKVKEVVGYLSHLEHILRGKKQALVVDNPTNTAISMLLENDVNKRISFAVRVFTEDTNAIDWLII